jgi:outer membrane protein assembly factor BamB
MTQSIAAALISLVSLSAAFAQPALTVSPDSGPPTAAVSIAGTSFGASEKVAIYFDAAELVVAVTTAAGDFSGVTANIPASATPGAHTILGIGQTSGLQAQTAFTVRANWVEFRRGLLHHGYNPTENVLNVSNVGDMQILWYVDLNGATQSAPAVVDGVIYIGSGDSKVYALDEATGKTIWSTATGSQIVGSSPLVAGGVVYIGSLDTKLYAMEAATGNINWSYPTGSGISSSPAEGNGIVYVGSSDDYLYALDASSGVLVWKQLLNTAIESSPVVVDGTVYAAAGDGNVFALQAATGQVIWEVATATGLESSPVVAAGLVFVAADKLYAFDTKTGHQVWSAEDGSASGGSLSSPAFAEGVIYVGSYDNNLYAFNAATGEQLWHAPTGGLVNSSPVVANGVVYVGSDDGNLYAFSAATGQRLWGRAIKNRFSSSPVVVNGTVFNGSYGSYFYAFGLPQGSPER